MTAARRSRSRNLTAGLAGEAGAGDEDKSYLHSATAGAVPPSAPCCWSFEQSATSEERYPRVEVAVEVEMVAGGCGERP